MKTVDLTALSPVSVTLGFLVSTIGGAFVLWILIDKIAWTYISQGTNVTRKSERTLTTTLGICERASYTAAILLGVPAWIGVWLAIKVAAQWSSWQDEQRATYNVFLIGNLLSILFGVLGAWIALRGAPHLGK